MPEYRDRNNNYVPERLRLQSRPRYAETGFREDPETAAKQPKPPNPNGGAPPRNILDFCEESVTDQPANTLHVHPTADLIEHDTSTPGPDCVCGPEVRPVPREDGSIGWLLIHHSLDAREQHEPHGT